MTESEPNHVTAAELARAWGVSRQNIHALKRKGIIRPLPSGLFDEAAARRDYLSRSDPAYRRAPKLGPTVVNQGVKAVKSVTVNAVKASPDPEAAAYLAAKAVKAHFRAGLAKLEYQQRAGILVDADEVKRKWFNTLRMVRDRILQLPDRLMPILVAETDPEKVKATLRAEIIRIIEDAENSDT